MLVVLPDIVREVHEPPLRDEKPIEFANRTLACNKPEGRLRGAPGGVDPVGRAARRRAPAGGARLRAETGREPAGTARGAG